MNREFYQSLNEAYSSMYEEKSSARQAGDKSATHVGKAIGSIATGAQKFGKGVYDAAKGAADSYGKWQSRGSRAFDRGMQGKEINKRAPLQDRWDNQMGRMAKNVPGFKGARQFAAGVGDAVGRGIGNTAKKIGDKILGKEEAQFCVGAYLLDSGLAETPLAASAIVEHMTDEYLEHLLNQIPEEDFNTLVEGGMFAGISDEALEKAATASLNKHKAQGYKVPGLNAMDDVVKRINARKKGQV